MGIDWKKEIKLSDLFRFKRSSGGGQGDWELLDTAGEEDGEEPESFLEEPGSRTRRRLLPRMPAWRPRLRSRGPRAPRTPLAQRVRIPAWRPKLVSRRSRAEDASPARRLRLPAWRPRLSLPRPGRSAGPGSARPEVPFLRAFNLLPKETREARTGPAAMAHVILGAVALVLAAGLASMILITRANVADKRTAKDDLAAELAALPAAGEEAGPRVDPALVGEQNARATALVNALGTRIAWDRLLRELSLVTPDDVWLSGLVGNPPEQAQAAVPAAEEGAPPPPPQPSSITVNGYTYGQDGVARILSRLAVVPELTSVSLLSSARTLLGETEVIQFSVTARVKLPGGAAA